MVFGEKIYDYKDEIIEGLCELVRFPSVMSEPEDKAPFGAECSRILKHVLKVAKKMGFKTKNINNYAGYAEYGTGEKTVAVFVHLDVVPAGDESKWDSNPFIPVIKDGKIFGRGTADNKCSAYSALYAMKIIKDSGIDLGDKRIRVVFGTNEERGMEDMKYYFTKEPLPYWGFVPDIGYIIPNVEKGLWQGTVTGKDSEDSCIISIHAGEAMNSTPDNCEIVIKNNDELYNKLVELTKENEKAEVSLNDDGNIVLKTKGQRANAIHPDPSCNAFYTAMKIVEEIKDDGIVKIFKTNLNHEINGKLLGIYCNEECGGELTVCICKCHMENGEFTMSYCIRYGALCNFDMMKKCFEMAWSRFNCSVNELKNISPMYHPKNSELIDRLTRAGESVYGNKPEIHFTFGGTYARQAQGRVVAFGGCCGGNIHSPNEFVYIDALMKDAALILQCMWELCQPE